MAGNFCISILAIGLVSALTVLHVFVNVNISEVNSLQTTHDECVLATNLLQTSLPCSKYSVHDGGGLNGSHAYLRSRDLQASSRYIPGHLTVSQNGLKLSQGLKSRIIARSGERVRYKDGRRSGRKFHELPDGAAVFERKGGDGWVYVSNAESRKFGGVGAITFDGNGNVLKYRMILEGTRRNCQGGTTPWNTFVSCEEDKNRGQCWETDPFGQRHAQKTTLGGSGGNYEAVTLDNRNKKKTRFFLTNDKLNGEIRRFTPSEDVVGDAMNGGDPWNILSEPGEMQYLVLKPQNSRRNKGTFSWSSSLTRGKLSAKKDFRRCEGISFMDGKLYFVSSPMKKLFALDLDRGTYTKTSTYSRRFAGKPDGVIPNQKSLFVSEEPSQSRKAGAGVYGYDLRGNFVTILDTTRLKGDATGVAFSPDKRRMYVVIQKAGYLFEITRRDGGRFSRI